MAIVSTTQVNCALPFWHYGANRLLCSCLRIEYHHMRFRHPNQAGDRAINKVKERIIIHIHFIHSSITGELLRFWVIACQVSGAIAPYPDLAIGALINTARKGGPTGIDGPKVGERICRGVEAEQMPCVGRPNVKLPGATHQRCCGVV